MCLCQDKSIEAEIQYDAMCYNIENHLYLKEVMVCMLKCEKIISLLYLLTEQRITTYGSGLLMWLYPNKDKIQ